MSRISEDFVRERLREAWDTLRRVPAHGIPGYRTAWPDIVQDYFDAYGAAAPVLRLPPASPRAIDRMHETFGWFTHLRGRPELAKVMWLSCGALLGARRVSDILGISRWTVRRYRNEAIALVRDGLSTNNPLDGCTHFTLLHPSNP